MTLQSRFAEALTRRGLRPIATKSRKYLVFADTSPHRYYYIGRSGSLRVGRCYSESVPVSNGHKRRLLGEAASEIDFVTELGL